MDGDTVCGVIKKQSQWGLSWNCRYMALVGDAIQIYKNERVFVKEGQCKYSLKLDDIKMEELSRSDTEVKIKVTEASKLSYKFQLSTALWDALTAAQNKSKPKLCSEDDLDITSPRHDEADDEREAETGTDHLVRDDQSAGMLSPSECGAEHGDHPKSPIKMLEDINAIIDGNTQVDINDLEIEVETHADEDDEIEADSEPATSDTNFAWNERYRAIFDIDDEEERQSAMQELMSEFGRVCKAHCVDLIENEETFLSKRAEGYVRDDIGFKFISSEKKLEKLRVVMRNCQAYTRAFAGKDGRIHCPLSCVVQYLNVRVYCRAALEGMSAENLVFGQPTSADEPFRCDAKVAELLSEAATTLNIAEHKCKYDTELSIATTSQLRVYETAEGVFYMDGVAALFPMDIVHCIKNESMIAHSARLHPNLVRSCADAISSDAFVPPVDDANDEIASQAIYDLHSNVIPRLASDLNSLRVTCLDCAHLAELMAERGIAELYIGELFSQCRVGYAQEIMVTRMLTQTVQNEVAMEPVTSRQALYDRVLPYTDCFETDEDELGIRERVVSAMKAHFGCFADVPFLRMKVLPSLQFLQSELARALDAECRVLAMSAPLCPLSVPLTRMALIQRDWQHELRALVHVENLDFVCFEAFRKSADALMARIDAVFPKHALKFQIQLKVCEALRALILSGDDDREEDAEVTDLCCALFAECRAVCAASFGVEHRQTLSLGMDVAKLRCANGRGPLSLGELEELKALLSSVRAVFGAQSANAAALLKVLSDVCYDLGAFEEERFAESVEFAKEHILILDSANSNAKRICARRAREYIALHLQIALIAEKRSDHALGLRFLTKLYHRLKKQMAQKKATAKTKKELWDDVDVRILSVLISRLKLRMSKQQKLKDVTQKWKSGQSHALSETDRAAYKKRRAMIIKNLCRNPTKKANDLLKDKADLLDVVCWIDLIHEFERTFLGAPSSFII